MPGGKVAVEEARVRMVIFREGVERRAVRMGAPTEPVAPIRRMFLRGAESADIVGERGWVGGLEVVVD